MPQATGTLIVFNVLVFLLQQALEPREFEAMVEAFALWIDPEQPLEQVLNAPWQLVTYGFLHGNVLHLGLNLFALWMFGADVERVWGAKRYLVAFFTSVVTGAIVQILAAAMSSPRPMEVVGASGGVFGILLCFAMLFPRRRVMLLFPPIPMQARTFVFVFAAFSLFLGVTGSAEGVAHFAHLGGLLGGWFVYRYGASLSAKT